MKITIETTQTTTTEKEIYFPYYSTDGKYYYCIKSEKDTLRCTFSTDHTSAWICRVDTNSLMKEAASLTGTSEDIFQQNYYKALEIITGIDCQQAYLQSTGELTESIKHHATQDGITTPEKFMHVKSDTRKQLDEIFEFCSKVKE